MAHARYIYIYVNMVQVIGVLCSAATEWSVGCQYIVHTHIVESCPLTKLKYIGPRFDSFLLQFFGNFLLFKFVFNITFHS